MNNKATTSHPAEYLTILRHMLGAHSKRPGYRNYYCVTTGCDSHAVLEQMEAAGLVEVGEAINDGRMQVFHATPSGMAAVGVERILD